MAQNRRNVFLWFTGGLFVVAFLLNFGFLGFIPNTVTYMTGWIIRPVGNLVRDTKNSITTFYSFSHQLKEIESLRREAANLKAENIRLMAIAEENERLRQLLDVSNTSDYETITAEIITRDATGIVQGATLNRGALQGIKKGGAVLDEQGNLAGIIEKIYSDTSQVLFITDAQVKIDTSVIGRNATGLAQGSHGVGIELGLLSQESIIEHNDSAVTAGISGVIPPGLPVGAVDEILSSETELFKRVTLVPYADIRGLRFVLVVINQ